MLPDLVAVSSLFVTLLLCHPVQVMTICKILEGILPKESVRGAPPPDKKLLEYRFVFACVWAFGGCMLVDKVGSCPTLFILP
jgi:dynein heavy chain